MKRYLLLFSMIMGLSVIVACGQQTEEQVEVTFSESRISEEVETSSENSNLEVAESVVPEEEKEPDIIHIKDFIESPKINGKTWFEVGLGEAEEYYKSVGIFGETESVLLELVNHREKYADLDGVEARFVKDISSFPDYEGRCYVEPKNEKDEYIIKVSDNETKKNVEDRYISQVVINYYIADEDIVLKTKSNAFCSWEINYEFSSIDELLEILGVGNKGWELETVNTKDANGKDYARRDKVRNIETEYGTTEFRKYVSEEGENRLEISLGRGLTGKAVVRITEKPYGIRLWFHADKEDVYQKLIEID